MVDRLPSRFKPETMVRASGVVRRRTETGAGGQPAGTEKSSPGRQLNAPRETPVYEQLATLAAVDQAVYRVELPVSHFKRFSSMLLDDTGEVLAHVSFARQQTGQTVATGDVSVVVALECQRCLRSMAYNIETRFQFGFVESEEAANQMNEDLDPVLLDEHGEVHVVDMLEDELILQLPLTQMHAAGEDCELPNGTPRAGVTESAENIAAAEKGDTHKPFGNLADLLKK